LERLSYLLDPQKTVLGKDLKLPADLKLRMMVFASTEVQALAWTYMNTLAGLGADVLPLSAVHPEDALLARVKLELAEGRSTPRRPREESLIALMREWPGSRRWIRRRK
jgi:hypothetical protein